MLPPDEEPQSLLDDAQDVPEVPGTLALHIPTRTNWNDPYPATELLDVEVTLGISGLPKFETSLIPGVREARLLNDAPWVRAVGHLDGDAHRAQLHRVGQHRRSRLRDVPLRRDRAARREHLGDLPDARNWRGRPRGSHRRRGLPHQAQEEGA